jgi:hypothetical protein
VGEVGGEIVDRALCLVRKYRRSGKMRGEEVGCVDGEKGSHGWREEGEGKQTICNCMKLLLHIAA